MSDGLDGLKAAATLFIHACSLNFPFLQISEVKAVAGFLNKQRVFIFNL